MRRKAVSSFAPVLDELPILENDDQDLVVREMPGERHVLVQTTDVVQRNAYRDATEVQGVEDAGDFGPGKDPLVPERPLEIYTKTDPIIVVVRPESLPGQPVAQQHAGQRKGDEPLLHILPRTMEAEPSPGALFDGGRLIGPAVPAKDRLVNVHVEAGT